MITCTFSKYKNNFFFQDISNEAIDQDMANFLAENNQPSTSSGINISAFTEMINN